MSTLSPKKALLALLMTGCLALAIARENTLAEAAQTIASSASEGLKVVRGAIALKPIGVEARGEVEVAFSPDLGAEELVIRVTDSATKDLRVMAYSFTSAKVTSAILRAAKRGVKVYLLADAKHNLSESSSQKGRAALSALANSGVMVRVVDAYSIFHDKVQIADGRVTQTGSFNYSAAAATRNSENVIVHWDNPALAKAYADHFERNWKISKAFTPSY